MYKKEQENISVDVEKGKIKSLKNRLFINIFNANPLIRSSPTLDDLLFF